MVMYSHEERKKKVQAEANSQPILSSGLHISPIIHISPISCSSYQRI